MATNKCVDCGIPVPNGRTFCDECFHADVLEADQYAAVLSAPATPEFLASMRAALDSGQRPNHRAASPSRQKA